MNEGLKPNIEISKLTNFLARLQEIKKAAEDAAQSIDNSKGLVGKALIAGLAKNEIKRSTSSN